ncbi:hypothetical protein DRO02_08700 [archaeon]|nr:MAG: hypothetical protein DRO02_08700 [archaeon]
MRRIGGGGSTPSISIGGRPPRSRRGDSSAMEVILFVERASADKLKEILLKDDLVSRANVLFKDAKPLEKEGYYVRILGSEEQCRKALELARDLAEEVSGEERERVLKLLRSEDEEMLSGFSGVFQ